MKIKFFNYKIVWFYNDIFIFDLYEDLSDFMKKNNFDKYFIVGGDDPLKNYVVFGRFEKEFVFFKNLKIKFKRKLKKFLTKRGKWCIYMLSFKFIYNIAQN